MYKPIAFLLPFLGLFIEITSRFFFNEALSNTSLVVFMAVWMIAWWILGIAPLGITALIPLVYLPLMQIMPLKSITPYYSDPMIFLFLGGFIIARGLEKTELSERFALNVLKVTGRTDGGIILGFIIATALLSMWISNTATAIMMIPIASSVLKFLQENTDHSPKDMSNMTVVIYLSIAYSANIGGTMTPIGTPPNVVLMGYLNSLYGIRIDFWRWVAIMAPVAALFLGMQYLLLNRLFKYSVPITEEFRSFVRLKIKELSPFNNAQRLAVTIFIISCSLWIFKDLINYLSSVKLLSDTGIALLGGLLLFFIPYKIEGFKRILDEEDIGTLPWNIILLFGGGMAMAGVMEEFGIIQYMVSLFDQVPATSQYLLVFLLAILTLLLTEVMSNVALCMIALPILMKLGEAKGIPPVWIGLSTAICASFAFSLPVSTPPNAIVFGTNKIPMKDMLRAGIIMNVLGVICVMSLGWVLMKSFLVY